MKQTHLYCWTSISYELVLVTATKFSEIYIKHEQLHKILTVQTFCTHITDFSWCCVYKKCNIILRRQVQIRDHSFYQKSTETYNHVSFKICLHNIIMHSSVHSVFSQCWSTKMCNIYIDFMHATHIKIKDLGFNRPFRGVVIAWDTQLRL